MPLGQAGMGLHKAAEEETKSLFVLCVSPRAAYNKSVWFYFRWSHRIVSPRDTSHHITLHGTGRCAG
ncbi:hypothetical protein V8C40DRAFT_251220 [Trichoderma camerunense]